MARGHGIGNQVPHCLVAVTIGAGQDEPDGSRYVVKRNHPSIHPHTDVRSSSWAKSTFALDDGPRPGGPRLRLPHVLHRHMDVQYFRTISRIRSARAGMPAVGLRTYIGIYLLACLLGKACLTAVGYPGFC